jgi:hypothetical protein
LGAGGLAVWKGQSTPEAQTREAAPQSDLDRLLAPIALYPDQLLAQILLCAMDPAGVTALDRFLKSNPTLKGTDLQDAVLLDNFEPNFVALALFPTVVARMASELDWTTRLGQAFTADKSAVFASIQHLRAQAQAAGALKTTPQQSVETQTTSAGEQVIIIEPANPQVVYVPQYNPQTVYVQSAPTTVVVEDNSADAAAAAVIGFTAGIAIGAAINNDYYYGPYGWYGGRAYMYNDAWDDYYDHREDAREDWQDHREDLAEERGDRRENVADERGDRAGTTQQQRTERQTTRQENRPQTQAAEQRGTTAKTTSAGTRSTGSTYEARGQSDRARTTTPERSGTRSDAFSGYSSGSSQRAASSRGQSSRSSSRARSGGGRRR